MREFMIAAMSLISLAYPAGAETRALTGYEGVSAEGRFRVEIAVGPEYVVTITGEDASRIATRVVDGVLKIEPARRSWFGEPRYNAVINVTVPHLTSVSAARGATVNAVGGGECGDFSATSAMGAVLHVRALECDNIEAASAMGAVLNLSGACGALDVSAAMGAEVEADQLRCRAVDASAAMGAAINAYASTTFDAAASMGGDISMNGGGVARDRSTAMGGSITQHN